MKNNRLLYAGGAVVALLLVALVWAVRSGGGDAMTAPAVAANATPRSVPAPAVPSTNPPTAQPGDAAPVAVAPSAPGAIAPPATDGTPPQIVHDHTGEVPPRGSPFTPDTVFAVRQSIAPLVKTCAEPLVRAGSSGTLTVVARFTIAGGKLSATPTSVSHTQFKDADFDACLQKAITEMALDAPSGQSDASYRLAIPFKFP